MTLNQNNSLVVNERIKRFLSAVDQNDSHYFDLEAIVSMFENKLQRNRETHAQALSAIGRGAARNQYGVPTEASYYREWRTIGITHMRQTGKTVWGCARFGDDTLILVVNDSLIDSMYNILKELNKGVGSPEFPAVTTLQDLQALVDGVQQKETEDDFMTGIKNVVVMDSPWFFEKISEKDFINSILPLARHELNFYFM